MSEKEVINVVLNELIERGIIKGFDLRNKTKSIFKNYYKLNRAIKNYETEISNLEKSKNKIDGPKMSRTVVGSEIKVNTHSSNDLDVIESRIRDLRMTIAKINCFLKEVDNILDHLPKSEADLIKRVYLKKENAKDIADELDCEPASIYRKISNALKKIEVELLPSDYINSI